MHGLPVLFPVTLILLLQNCICFLWWVRLNFCKRRLLWTFDKCGLQSKTNFFQFAKITYSSWTRVVKIAAHQTWKRDILIFKPKQLIIQKTKVQTCYDDLTHVYGLCFFIILIFISFITFKCFEQIIKVITCYLVLLNSSIKGLN